MNKKYSALAFALTLVSSFALSAQTTSKPAAKKSSSGSGGHLYEINLFGGGNFVNSQEIAPHQDLSNGGAIGFRVTQNFWDYVGIEESGTVHAVANAVYRIPGTERQYSFGSRLRQFSFNPVFYFKPRESRIRPFVTAGFGMDYFGVTEGGRGQVGNGVNTPFMQQTELESQFRLAFNYGVGLKARLTDRFGLRFDARGFSTASPSFGVKGAGPAGAITYTRTTPMNSAQTTAGIVFYMGPIDNGPVCDFRVGSIEPSTRTVWVGESASYQLSVNNDCLGVTPKYKWTIDGQPATGDSMLAVNNQNAGEHAIKSVVEADITKVVDRRTKNFLKKAPIPATERSASLIVKQPKVELVSLTVDPTTINHNGTALVTSVISFDGPAAGQEVSVVYTTSAGRLAPSNSGPNTSVSDDGKTVTIKSTVKPGNNTHNLIFSTAGMSLSPGGPSVRVNFDSKLNGQQKNASLTVNSSPAPAPTPAPEPPRPQPMQLDDVVFAKGSARVNNCGKRILDQAFERAASMGDFEVLLVGHFDAVEKNINVRDPKTKKQTKLDEERVLQVAAVLSAGIEPCKRLERSRIKVAFVGAEQLTAFRTSLCEASVKERSSGKISPADGSAKNRRVEIWLVPKSGPMPNGIAGIHDAPASEIQSKGCPK